MTYAVNKPQASDYLAVSQVDLLNINQGVNTSSGQDHVPFNEATDPGKHNKVTLTDQASAGDPATSATECALYQKITSANTEVFYRPLSSGTIFQMTSSGALNLGDTAAPMGVRAMGRFSLGATPALIGTPFNVTAVTRPATGVFNIQLTNAVADTNYLVLFSVGKPSAGTPLSPSFFYEVVDTSNIRFQAFSNNVANNYLATISISFAVIR